MPQLAIILFVVLINLFPYLRWVLPQREEEWLFKVTRKHAPIVKLIHAELIRSNEYYQKLSRAGQQKFIKRVLYLILRKTIVGYHDLKLDLNMAILVLSAQVQLTFGMRRFSLPHFKKIVLYPDIFYSKYFGQDVKGLTSGLGFINLSWRHSKEGYEDYNDNLNLLLHEFSHALMVELKMQTTADNRVVRSFEKHGEKAVAVFERINEKQGGSHPYLRDYGFTNTDEFFSVCVEHFFETPELFKRELRELFDIYCKLLNQNPLNTNNDYRLT